MINLDSSVFETDVLFLQPTWSCKKNCPGCFVKEKEERFGSEQMPEDLWSALIDDVVVYGNKIRTNQVTMALDTLSSNDWDYENMYRIGMSYRRGIRSKLQTGTKKHLTVNCVSDLEPYAQTDLFEGLDLISVSNINSLSDIERIRKCAPFTKINWNILSSSFIIKTNDQIKTILRSVNQAYLLLHKAPLGEQGHDFDSWNKAINIIKEIDQDSLIDRTAYLDGEACEIPSITSKIIIDGCMQDAFNFKKTSEGCCSNISRFQIWPDGRVTGCAYNSHERYGKFAESLDDIVDNLREARQRYEFNSCTIPQFGLTSIRK